MPIAQSLLPEFEHEMANTRKVLERLPDDRFAYQPHAKSMTLGQLASHLVNMASWGVATMTTASLDLAPVDGEPMESPKSENRAAALARFDEGVASFRAALEGASDAAMLENWSLLLGGKAMFTMPRIAVVRGMVLNHMIHHRAQLALYYRMNDIPVPALYGPSADER
ncbi:MAG: DinB family protein [Bryobacteraceae bacterium]|nr:DinB family protein [Bryobacteraceae bacterium]